MGNEFLEYPTFKEKHPDKTLSDWLLYSKRNAYKELNEMYSTHRNDLNENEQKEIRKSIGELRGELVKMNIDQLKFKIIDEMCGYTFTYKGEPCGIEPTVENGVFTFDAWHGDKNKDYTDIDELMNDKFYSSKSLTELIDTVELDFI